MIHTKLGTGLYFWIGKQMNGIVRIIHGTICFFIILYLQRKMQGPKQTQQNVTIHQSQG